MSFTDAIGQIDQIVQWEQQLADPAALTQATGTGGVATTADTSSTSASGTSSGASFADALTQAQAQEGGDELSLLDAADGSGGAGLTGASTGSTATLLGGGDSALLAALSSAGGSGTTDSTSVLSALESALASSGATANATTATTTGGVATTTATIDAATATSPEDPRIEAMAQEANSLLGKPYVWGGGHDGWDTQSGYDCSGFVSAVLHAGGYLSTPQDTTTLPTAAGIASGPGQYVTIYDRDAAGQEGHVIIEIDGQFYESGGQHGSWGGGGGVEQIATPSASYLATFNQVLHPAGL